MDKGGKLIDRGPLVALATERLPSEPERKLRDGLRRCALFSQLDDSVLTEIARASALTRFLRRRQVYGQQERPSAVYVLMSGRVRVVRYTGDERALTVAYLGAGDLVGETAFLGGDHYRDAATATDHGEAVRVPISRMRDLLRYPGFAGEMLRLMLERRLQAESRIESLLSRSVESRVSEFLLDAGERHGIPDSRGLLISVKYTHQEIADYVGSTRETVTLTLGEFKRRSLVLFDHRRIVLLDVDALKALL
jgi:CRP-like cAMP-binding protein